MKLFVIITLFLTLISGELFAKEKPLFSNKEIDVFSTSVKSTKKIPDKAIDILFLFYKKNRLSTGGLKASACVDKKAYTIRWQDPGFTKKAIKQGIKNESCLCVMDYTRNKYEKRGHCIFLEKGKTPKIESFLVAHGSGSNEKKGIPQVFTNKVTPTGTTLSGLSLTAPKMYRFSGNVKVYGKYRAPGLGLYGVESSNWTAARVGKVAHGAPYVKYLTGGKKEVGRSKGCSAMQMDRAKTMLPKCMGQAAWLNYTNAIRDRPNLEPLACKQEAPPQLKKPR